MAELSALQLALLAQKASEQRRWLAAEPIAIVGIGCRFPGPPGQQDLDSPERFWEFLLAGSQAVGEVPANRWSLDHFYSSRPGTPGKMHCRHGAFLAHPDRFEPTRFGISPREAYAMDPQHRLLLEVGCEALERAGYGPAQVRGLLAGVYVGICTSDYATRQLRGSLRDSDLDFYFATGNSFAMAAGRLAYALGLEGPALAVDTACSSSLVAVDLACRGLRDRSIDLALAGGVSLLLAPENSLCFARSGMMSADGRCKTFDASADGYVRGEGCGLVVLKRLSDALEAGDPVLAVVRGSCVNQDGASAGLTVPNGDAQASLIRRTLEQAQLQGDQIDVLEAHGTGTPLGDPIELKALAPIYGRPERVSPLRLASVKTNLGHLEGAAGIAGLIKAVLMVQHGRIPPHLHLRQLTPYLNWSDWSLQIPTALESWPQRLGPRRAAVSSFGFSGTNAHVIVEQAPQELSLERRSAPSQGSVRDWLLLSASTEVGIRSFAAAMARWLADQPVAAWPDICATSRQARSSLSWRLAIHALDPNDAIRQLRHPLTLHRVPDTPPPLAFELTEFSSLSHWYLWQAFGLEGTALVHGLDQQSLVEQIAGHPARLRLIPAGLRAVDALAQHGYGLPVRLEAPQADGVVDLWLRGHNPSWHSLEPRRLWQRQVLPTTPFERIRCWVEERVAEENLRFYEGLQHGRHWKPLPTLSSSEALSTEPPWLIALDAGWDWESSAPLLFPSGVRVISGLPALDQALFESVVPPVLVLVPPHQVPNLKASFWATWLPLLQGVMARSHRFQVVHWLLPDLDPIASETWAALARSWLREVGNVAGGLLWCGLHSIGLEPLLLARGGVEWRLNAAGMIESSALDPIQDDVRSMVDTALDPMATTLITGGLGSLGLATAEALQQRGARHLTLVARRPPGHDQQDRLAVLEQRGVTLAIELLDLSDAAAVDRLFSRIVASGRPLAGIIHAAGVLDDGLLINQTPARCAAVAAGKVQGAIHLDRCSRAIPHDFFVLYSSLAALLGSPGQIAYAAANGFLDGLAMKRRAAGLPGLSINWGPWAGEGMAAGYQGSMEPLAPSQAVALLHRWLFHQGRVVLASLKSAAGTHPLAPRLLALVADLATLQDPLHQQQAVERCLADVLAELGGFSSAELQPHTRLDALGLDSLMAVDLATAVHSTLGLNLGLAALSGDPTLGSLAAHLLALWRQPDLPLTETVVDLADQAKLPGDLSDLLAACSGSGFLEQPGNSILVTGATGFLGAFLLADQFQRHPQLTIYCLVRADGAGAARARVRSNLQRYGLWREEWASRLVGLPGDLAVSSLGVDQDIWSSLLPRLGGILHCGAQLSYVAPYSRLSPANVGGTEAVLRLAARRKIPLEYISSTAVFEARAYRDCHLDENTDLQEWEGIYVGYSQTKWVSERLVWQAAEAGLPVRIHRPPLIAGHSRTGAWHEQDVLHRLIRGCLALGEAPELPMLLDFVPVDYVAEAVGVLAWTSPPQGRTWPDVVHLTHPRPVLWTDFLSSLIARGAPLKPVPLEPWLQALATQPDNPLYPLQPFFTQRWGIEQLTYPQLNQPGHRARPSCQLTLERLNAHGVYCPEIEELIDPYAHNFLSDLLANGVCG